MLNRMFLLLAMCVINGACIADCTKTVVLVRHGEKNEFKPRGQLDCQGLNRSLALSSVLRNIATPIAIYAANPNVTTSESFNRCDTFPRALATIEPTAIALGMQVLTPYGIGHVGGPSSPSSSVVSCDDAPTGQMLQLPQAPVLPGACGEGSSAGDMDLAREILSKREYCDKTVFVAWEHGNIPIIAYSFYKLLGLNPVNAIPLWPYGRCLTTYAEQGFCRLGNCSPGFNYDTIYTLTINQSRQSPSIEINLSRENLDNQSIDCPT